MGDMRIFFVGGAFDDDGGKPSSCAAALSRAIQNRLPHENDKPKLVDEIKRENPTCLLVTSKRNLDERYDPLMLVARALRTKSNLLLEVTGSAPKYEFTLWDPLGNVFATRIGDLNVLADRIAARIMALRGMTRIRSRSVGPAIMLTDDPQTGRAEELWRFCSIIRAFGVKFHELIRADTGRFLGNASFRCEHGFPSMRYGNLILVSRRDVDKRDIGPEGLVAARGGFVDEVQYYGDAKPSVDTPIQLELYGLFPNARFMLHSHAYVLGAPFTGAVLPCGAVEEAQEVLRLFGGPGRVGLSAPNLRVNLRGHGSLVMAGNLGFLEETQYVARQIPENHGEE